MATSTSFKKKASGKPSHPRGTRPSLHNAQLLVSTGVPSMDALLGSCADKGMDNYVYVIYDIKEACMQYATTTKQIMINILLYVNLHYTEGLACK